MPTASRDGETVVSSTGVPGRLNPPLNFLVVTDHSENHGLAAVVFGRESAQVGSRSRHTNETRLSHKRNLYRLYGLGLTEGVARRVKSAPKVSAADLHNWKLLAAFRERMEPLLAQAPVTATEADPRRTLHMGDYFAMVLFAMLNPVIATTRSLCASSSLERMQAEVCGGPVSLGSFSEM